MEIAIGKKLYRYISGGGMFEYAVFGVHDYDTGTEYAIRCEACTHGYKCELLVGFDDYKKLVFIRMLNHSCDEDHEDQRYWHANSSEFFETVHEANIQLYESLIAKNNDKLSEARNRVNALVKMNADCEEALKVAIESSKELTETAKAK